MGEYNNVEWEDLLIICRQKVVSRAVERIIENGGKDKLAIVEALHDFKNEGYPIRLELLSESDDMSNRLWWGDDKEVVVFNPDVREDIKKILYDMDCIHGYHYDAVRLLTTYVENKDIEVIVEIKHPWADIYKNFTFKLV